MTTLEILRAARERLTDPTKWTKGGGREEGPRCVDLTIDDLGDNGSHASHALSRVLGFPERVSYIHRWNDDPATTHADVLAALDKTIAIEEAKVAA